MWFTETPWPPIFICIAGIVLLGAAWRQNGRGNFLVGLLVLLVACPVIFAFERYYVTEPEVVEGRITDLAAAVEKDDVESVLAFFSKDELGLQNKIRLGMSQFRIEDGMRITDVDARYDEARTTIVSRFRANGSAAMKGNTGASRHVATMWELTWRREEDEWRIFKVQRLNPMTEEPIDVLSREGG